MSNFPGGVTQDEFVTILYKDTLFDDANYALWFHDNEDYLIHFKLMEEYSIDSSDLLSENEQRETLQNYRCYLHECHQAIPLRKLGKEENAKDAFYVYDYGLNLPQTQAFLSFIDAHIPDSESGYFFAERVYEQLLAVAT